MTSPAEDGNAWELFDRLTVEGSRVINRGALPRYNGPTGPEATQHKENRQ